MICKDLTQMRYPVQHDDYVPAMRSADGKPPHLRRAEVLWNDTREERLDASASIFLDS